MLIDDESGGRARCMNEATFPLARLLKIAAMVAKRETCVVRCCDTTTAAVEAVATTAGQGWSGSGSEEGKGKGIAFHPKNSPNY